MIIEWCVQNEKFGTRDVIANARALTKLEDLADFSFSRYACTEDCALCCRNPFVILNHTEKLTATSAGALWDMVFHRIRRVEETNAEDKA